jgi:4-diphosphocytidyl-2-C-methyl-D-erythritol kinase
MSGSGATLFGLFKSCRSAAIAAKNLKLQYPDWWIKATSIR